MVLMMRCTRSITSAKSNSALALLKPYSLARAMYESILAERSSDLLGTQPEFRQSPPMRCRSISVTFAFTVAAISAATRPPEPAPMTTRFVSKRFGFLNRRSTRRALNASSAFLAISGATPSSANDTHSVGDRMSPAEAMLPSSAPALTYTAVPNSMPSWLTQ